MEHVGGLFTFLQLFLAASYVILSQPFNDLHIAQSYYKIQSKVLEAREYQSLDDEAFKMSKTCSFKVRWCLLRLCCFSRGCQERYMTKRRETLSSDSSNANLFRFYLDKLDSIKHTLSLVNQVRTQR